MNFKNLTNKLLSKQEEEMIKLRGKQETAKEQLADKIVENTMKVYQEATESLIALGCEDKLNDKALTKVVKVEVPVEVPTEELENLKINANEMQAIINGLQKAKEQLEKENKQLQKKLDKANENLASKEAMYKGLIRELGSKVVSNNKNIEEDKEIKQQKEHKELEIPKIENIKIIKNYDNYILGEYKGTFFEASKNMECITIYNPKKYHLKDEINKILIEQNILNPKRETKDKSRIECELGVCHEISPNKYMGYFMDDNKPVCYIFDKGYNNGLGTPTTQKIDIRMKNPKKKYSNCKDASKIKKINELIDLHIAKEEELSNNIDRSKAYEFLGLNNNEDNKNKDTKVKQPMFSNTTGSAKQEEKKEVVKQEKKQTMGDMFSFDTSYASVEL